MSGIAYRSDRVQPGDAFFCIVGMTADGHSFAQDAIDRGAKVLVVERKVYLADATDVTRGGGVRHAQGHGRTRRRTSTTIRRRAFSLVGITGTNGKTTTTYLVEHIARVCGQAHRRHRHRGHAHRRRAGEDRAHHAGIARPAAAVRAHARRALRRGGHGGELARARPSMRTWDAAFAVTAFSNLTQDHLDYHHTFEAYFEAKALPVLARLSGSPRHLHRRQVGQRAVCGAAPTNGDSVVTTGFDPAAQIHPVDVRVRAHAHRQSCWTCAARVTPSPTRWWARFNVENVMCAFGIGLQLGFSRRGHRRRALAEAPQMPGPSRARARAARRRRLGVRGLRAHPRRAGEGARVHHGAHARPHHLRVRLRRRPRRGQAPHHGHAPPWPPTTPWSRATTRATRTRWPSSTTSCAAWARGERGASRWSPTVAAAIARAIELAAPGRLRAGGRQGPRGLPAGGRPGAVASTTASLRPRSSRRLRSATNLLQAKDADSLCA